MRFVAIVIFLCWLAPLRSNGDLRFRVDLARAIEFYAPSDKEVEVLGRLAWYEGAFRPDVAQCKTVGDHGKSLGLFQIQPQNPYDRRAACGSLHQQVQLALQFLRHSAEGCPGFTGADQLALYVAGKCVRGIREAKNRWGGLVPGDDLRGERASKVAEVAGEAGEP